MIGSLYADTFNVTLSFAPTGGAASLEPTEGLITAVANVVDSWWNDPLVSGTGGLGFSQEAKLTSIKLNRIGPDGKYVDTTTHERIFATPIAGGGNTGGVPQLSVVSTLRGPDVRGAASKGRMYWPVSKAAMDPLLPNGTISTTLAGQHASGTAVLIRALNNAYVGASVPAVAAIASKVGGGRFQVVTKVSVGRVVDTMRSRRNKLDEDPVEVAI